MIVVPADLPAASLRQVGAQRRKEASATPFQASTLKNC